MCATSSTRLLSVGFTLIFTFLKVSSNPICTQAETLKCIQKVDSIVAVDTVQFFGSEEELIEICSTYLESLDCMDRYSQECLPEKRMRVMHYFMEGPRKFIHNLCKDESYKQSFLKLSSCFTNDEDKASLNTCTNKFAKAQLSSRTEENSSDNNRKLERVLQNTCIALWKFRNCGKAVAERHCGHSTAMFFERVLIDITGPLVRSACRGKKQPRKPGRTMHIHGKSAASEIHDKNRCFIFSVLTVLMFIFIQKNAT